MQARADDRQVEQPDIYTHHDNAIRARDKISATFERSNLSPNMTFANAYARDSKMYHLSDLSNLDVSKVKPRDNHLDKFLELENILPHQNTLARGF